MNGLLQNWVDNGESRPVVNLEETATWKKELVVKTQSPRMGSRDESQNELGWQKQEE